MGCGPSSLGATCRGLLGVGFDTRVAPPHAEQPEEDPLRDIPDTPDVRVDYLVKELIGKGSFGICYRAISKVHGRVVVLKSLDRKAIKASSIHREWSVLENLGSHPYVVGYHGTYKTATNVSFVLEYMSGGELFERLLKRGACPEAEVRLPCKRLAEALRYVHSRGIVHRDLKPENILLASASPHSWVMKLADFGLSQLIQPNERLLKVC